MIHHKGKHYPGNHQALIDQDLWDQAQAQLAANASKVAPATSSRQSYLLTGVLFDGNGQRLSPSPSTKRIKGSGTRRYTYNVSASLVRGQSKQETKGGSDRSRIRLAAPELDALGDDPTAVMQASSIMRIGRSIKLFIGSVDINEPCVDQAMVDQLRQAHR